MAATKSMTSDFIAARLREILVRARDLKKSTAVEPPLQVSELASDNEDILARVSGNKDKHVLAFESAARNVFYGVVGSTPIEDPAFVDVWNLLDILQYCGDKDLCSPQLLLLVVEELLDSQSIAGCRIAFTFLETRREAIITNTSKNKDLVILRLSNELLRRISRAEDPVFCGRVYVFMFQSFPLGDRSSVNLRGAFHVENVTTFEDWLKAPASAEDDMQLDPEATADEVKEASVPEVAVTQPEQTDTSAKDDTDSELDIDALYPEFWGLQHSFSNPPRLFDEDKFNKFKKSLENTLEKFKKVPKVIQSGDSEQGKEGAQTPSNDDPDPFASAFNPKYLTSRDLFKLELSDLAFQRHILVQALILIDFLLGLTEKGKSQPYYQKAQKAMQYNFTLREEDAEWALGIKNAIANYLQEGPEGKFYYRMVDTVLSRDKNWVRWKMENCQPFTRDRVPTKDFLDAKSEAKAEVARKTVSRSSKTQHLKFLSNTAEKGLEQLKLANRPPAPSVDSYVKKVRTNELDLEMAASDEEKRQLEERKTSNTWRGLRLAAKSRLSSFDRLEQGKGLERLFQPAASTDAAGEGNAATTLDDRGSAPHEEQRADKDVK